MLDIKTALVLAPHADDGEFGCGGAVARLVEEGIIVHCAVFSIAETSIPKEFPPDIMATEVKDATQVLGILPQNLVVHRYPVRYFPDHRQEILEELVKLRQQVMPDLVFLPSSDDIHQDHQVVNQEGIRAFKHTTILGCELPWNNLQSTASALVPLQSRHVAKKVEAIRQYKTQEHRSYASSSYLEGLARVRGQQADTDYAEAFQVIRWIIR